MDYDFDNLWRFQNTVHDESIKILHPYGIFWFSTNVASLTGFFGFSTNVASLRDFFGFLYFLSTNVASLRDWSQAIL